MSLRARPRPILLSRRCVIAALAIALCAVACSDPPEPPEFSKSEPVEIIEPTAVLPVDDSPPAAFELLDAGQAPRAPLRYRFTAGVTQTIKATLDIKTRFGTNSSFEMPTLEVIFVVTVDEVTADGATVTYRVEQARLLDGDGKKKLSAAIIEPLKESVGTLGGMRFRGKLSPRGEVLEAVDLEVGKPLVEALGRFVAEPTNAAVVASLAEAGAKEGDALSADTRALIDVLESAVAKSDDLEALGERFREHSAGFRGLLALGVDPATRAQLEDVMQGAMARALSTPAQKIIEGLQNHLTKASPMLPEEPVGPGARWTVRHPITSEALKLERVATYTLDQRDEKSALLRFEGLQSPVAASAAPTLTRSGPSGDSFNMVLEGIKGTESGKLTIALDRPIPQLESDVKLNLKLLPGGSDQSIYSSSAIQVRLSEP